GRSSSKLERTSRCEASQPETPATRSAAARKRHGYAREAAVSRASGERERGRTSIEGAAPREGGATSYLAKPPVSSRATARRQRRRRRALRRAPTASRGPPSDAASRGRGTRRGVRRGTGR